MSSASVLGLEISGLGLDAAVAECRARVARGIGGYACFVNAHTASESAVNPDLRAALQGATYRFPDGMPIVWVARWKGHLVEGRVCGPDFMSRMLDLEQSRVHAFVGGAPEVAAELARRRALHAISYSPPMRPFSAAHAIEDWNCVLELAGKAGAPPIVWVGLGAPKQELWLRTVASLAPGTLFFGVGAAFDFLSGRIRRAPAPIQKVGLEWAFRLANDPRRLWRRYLVTNSRFIALAVREMMFR